MRLSPVLTVLSALAAVVLFGLVGAPLIAPNRPLLENVAFSVNIISPNADGDSDLTKIRYTVNKTARVSVVFTETTTGETFRFRDEATRAPNTYEVLFSGVVEGYTLPDERIEGVIERRLIPNGLYRWTLTTTTETGEMSSVEGDLTISGVDSRLPALTTFEVSPKEFTPNQDGYDDRVSINLTLEKPATLTVWLENDTNGPYYIAERVIAAATADGAGAREFDYDGGVDNNMTPPPDGEYRLIAVAQDAEGQRVRRETTIQLRDGGLPNAEIVAQSSGRTVTWAASTWEDRFFHDRQTRGALVEPPLTVQSTQAQISLPQGDLLVFAMTVSNYGTTPIRTIGPFPGTAYSYDQTDAAMTAPERREAFSGAWRVGVQCERSESSYPWRWALGSPDALTTVERDGETLYYLLPGQKALVWGAVRMTRLIPTRNPQKCFAALIHEDVAIPPRQNRIGEIDVRLE